jgi:hypothetical protein
MVGVVWAKPPDQHDVLPIECESTGSDHDSCRIARAWDVALNSIGIGWSYFCNIKPLYEVFINHF